MIEDLAAEVAKLKGEGARREEVFRKQVEAEKTHAKVFDGVRRGVLIAESLWPNSAYPDGRGINTLTGADPIAPFGGAAFHDNKVWLKKMDAERSVQ